MYLLLKFGSCLPNLPRTLVKRLVSAFIFGLCLVLGWDTFEIAMSSMPERAIISVRDTSVGVTG